MAPLDFLASLLAILLLVPAMFVVVMAVGLAQAVVTYLVTLPFTLYRRLFNGSN